MLGDILKTKLESADAECESTAAAEIQALYSQAHYDGSRFVAPSFQEAGSVWIKLVKAKENEFIQEIVRVSTTSGAYLSRKDVKSVTKVLEHLFRDERYLERVRVFSEGVVRTASRYGIAFEAEAHGLRIHGPGYQAAAKNALRRARKNVMSELELHCAASAPDRVLAASKAWSYFLAHPLRFAAIVFLGVVLPWVFTQIDLEQIGEWVQMGRAWWARLE